MAELYDRARPRYSSALFADLVLLSRIPAGGRILEIGAGTGQATLPLAERGFAVVSLEPGPRLAAIARRHLAGHPNATIVEQTFEAWQGEPRAFHLVVAARAFHWVARDVRFAKSARALEPGGALAVVGTAPLERDTPLDRAIEDQYARIAPSLAERGAAIRRDLEDEFVRSGLFDVLPTREYRSLQRYSDREYVELLQTHSSHRLLPEAQRTTLLEAIRQTIAARGGSFDVEYVSTLTLGFVRG